MASTPMLSDIDVRAARRIRARIRAWGADVVHAHDARSHALALIALLGKRGIPLVVTRRVPFTPRSVRLKYGDRIARFIAISHAVKKAMISGGIDAERIDVVHSGIAIPETAAEPRDWRCEARWSENTVVCGVVGAMTSEKGLDLLDAIAQHLPPPSRESSRLVLLGGPRLAATTIGGIPALRPGFVEEIESAVAGLDVLFHPSRAEGLGTAVLDGMAQGVPPVAFATGGLPEVIVSEESGLLVRPGDVPAFAEAAARLIADPDLRRRLGDAAKTRARAFDSRKMTEGTEAVYYRVLTR